MKIIFTERALSEYMEWQTGDKKTLKRINELIKSIQRDGFMGGIGKAEPLKYRKGYSRRIDETNRLIYRIDSDKNLEILSCKGHYDD